MLDHHVRDQLDFIFGVIHVYQLFYPQNGILYFILCKFYFMIFLLIFFYQIASCRYLFFHFLFYRRLRY